jgi:hypothetical protein
MNTISKIIKKYNKAIATFLSSPSEIALYCNDIYFLALELENQNKRIKDILQDYLDNRRIMLSEHDIETLELVLKGDKE